MILRSLALAALAFAIVTAPAEAAKGAKGQKGGAKTGRFLARFDRDHNGVIDGEEVARLQAVYTSLAALDTDHNGQLSETEIAAAKVPVGKRAAGKAAASAAAPTTAPAKPAATPAPKPQ